MKSDHTPRRKKLGRKTRLIHGKTWTKLFSGKHIVKAYCRWFGVDMLCALKELKLLGVELPEAKERQMIQSFHTRIDKKKKSKEHLDLTKKASDDHDETYWFIAGYTSNGVPYGLTHEESEGEGVDF